MSAYLQSMFDLTDRVALCTGASNGIGRRMARALAWAGANVMLVGRDETGLAEVCREIIDADGGDADSISADLTDRDGLSSIVELATRKFGAPDIITNAAGLNLREPFEEVSDETWEETLNINLSVPFFLSRLCIPGMQSKGGGNIINVGSLQSYRAFPNSMAYGAAKGGVIQLTRAMAQAWSSNGITTNAIIPGFFPTHLTEPVFSNPDLVAHHTRMTPAGRLGEMEDLDGITVFLASAGSKYITGQAIPVDGGYTAN
jgi:NAD(P)-dependent dehydrogenase (short-subunit alcohol dehydrogenase family)